MKWVVPCAIVMFFSFSEFCNAATVVVPGKSEAGVWTKAANTLITILEKRGVDDQTMDAVKSDLTKEKIEEFEQSIPNPNLDQLWATFKGILDNSFDRDIIDSIRNDFERKLSKK